MNNIVALPVGRDWKYHAARIRAAWGKMIASIIETGEALIDAKEELGHGGFLAMVQSELPFDRNTAHRLMKIAAHPVLSNVAHGPHLPPHWRTLYELTKMNHGLLLAKLKDGSINPKTTRKDIVPARTTKPPKRENGDRGDIDGIRSRLAQLCQPLSRDQRIHQVDLFIKALDLNIRDWVSTFQIKKRR